MRKITADRVCPVSSDPIDKGVVILDEKGKILAIETREKHDAASLEIRKGTLIPGFINAHCHLELSHLKNAAPTGTGLIPFITTVVTKRGSFSQNQILEAIECAETEMFDAGIVAVGDISNAPDTFAAKTRGRLRYHTFLELFDFLQDQNAAATFENGKAVFEKLELAEGHKKSFVPHAPYSVSASLFEKINAANAALSDITVSIHNQETPPENELFLSKKGDFLSFYSGFGISLKKFRATKKPSIHWPIEKMDTSKRPLFVHNTLTKKADIDAADAAFSSPVFWASCPNANLFIENRLPDYRLFIEKNARVCLGTDSYTSNWQLSILEEMKTIRRFQNFIGFETLLRWATLNGAEALGFERDLGSLEVGKTPGLLLLSAENLDAKTTVERLV